MSSPHSEEPATFVTAPGDRSASRRNGRKPGRVAKRQGDALGVVTRGSLVEGLEMKLDPARNVEDMKAGKFVVIEGGKNDFFSMVTDMRLDATNPDILLHPRRRKTHFCEQRSAVRTPTTSCHCGRC